MLFEPLEHTGTVDVEVKFVVGWIALDLHLCVGHIEILTVCFRMYGCSLLKISRLLVKQCTVENPGSDDPLDQVELTP